MALLKFIFGSFWTFAGAVVLMFVIASCINSHVAEIQDARTKRKRTIHITRYPDRTMVWVEYPTDEDVKKVLTDKSLELKPGKPEGKRPC